LEIFMKKQVVILVAGAFFVASCTTNPYTGETEASKTGVGAGLGAIVGGIGGAILGGGKRSSILIGAGVGALVGGGIGSYMDRQETVLRERLRDSGVSVTRVGDNIILNMPGNVTFSSNKAELKPAFYEVLNSVALVLNEYDRSLIDVDGHTDSDGPDDFNLDLSTERARAVADFLTSQQVNPQRLQVRGLGEREPIASNQTARGKAQNRRVEIKIVPLTS
jgi:outer membrane protein OmpA-like peptidoglycan-associated protein